MNQVWKLLSPKILVEKSRLLQNTSALGNGLLVHNLGKINLRAFSCLTSRIGLISSASSEKRQQDNYWTLRQPILSNVFALELDQRRGMKVKARVRRRCKDCYLEYISGILHNFCKTHGRHKQMLKPKYWANQRILTEVSQCPKKPW